MAHAAPFIPLPVPHRASNLAEPRFALDSLVVSGPRKDPGSRVLGSGAFSLAVHVIVIAAIIVLPLVVGEDVLPATSDAVRAFFVPPAEVALPPPPPPPPSGARALKPAPAPPRPTEEAKFTAPIEVPELAEPEESLDLGIEGGVPGGVEGGVPGGVIGGIVGGLPQAPPPTAAGPVPVRVGGMIRTPKLLNLVKPAYPPLAVQARTVAVVTLEAIVGPDGRVQTVKVLRGQPLFDDAALEAVKQWRYQPLLLNGIPVPFVVNVTLKFNIMNKES